MSTRTLSKLAAIAVILAAIFHLWSLQGEEIKKNFPPQKDQIGELIKGLGAEEFSSAESLALTNPDELLLADIVANEMLRLDVIDPGFETVQADAARFLEFVKIVESNGNPLAKAKTSSAMSLFQFTVPSVPTAVNRLENYMTRHYLGPLPNWAEELRESPKSLYQVPERRQAILTLVNIAEQRGSDGWLRQYFSGEEEAAKSIYFLHHHTDPDDATNRRVKKIFARVYN